MNETVYNIPRNCTNGKVSIAGRMVSKRRFFEGIFFSWLSLVLQYKFLPLLSFTGRIQLFIYTGIPLIMLSFAGIQGFSPLEFVYYYARFVLKNKVMVKKDKS